MSRMEEPRLKRRQPCLMGKDVSRRHSMPQVDQRESVPVARNPILPWQVLDKSEVRPPIPCWLMQPVLDVPAEQVPVERETAVKETVVRNDSKCR